MPANSGPDLAGPSFAGRVVLLSGATGAVGSALCARLGKLGARLGIAVRRKSQIRQVGEALGHGKSLIGVVGTRDSEAAAGLVKGIEDSLGPIEHFISTAGAFRYGLAGEEHTGDAGILFEANLLSVVNLVRAVVGPMKRRRAGSIVLTGARSVGDAVPGMALYLASKAALHQYAAVLHAECRGCGVRVAVVSPGVLDTEANRRAMRDADRSSWLPIPRMVDALLDAAAGQLPGNGPLYLLD